MTTLLRRDNFGLDVDDLEAAITRRAFGMQLLVVVTGVSTGSPLRDQSASGCARSTTPSGICSVLEIGPLGNP